MAGNSFGKIFSISTFGESHGKAIGVVIDGCPPGIQLNEAIIQSELEKRRPGQSRLTSSRKEADQPEILSGIFEGKTTGAPIAILIPNQDARSKDYDDWKDLYRPSHADFTYDRKYGFRDYRGGGRSSARETAARVAAGAVAMAFLKTKKIQITAFVTQVGEIKIDKHYKELDFSMIEGTPVRCPDIEAAKKMEAHILRIKKAGDSIGGIIQCVITGCPYGLGEPVFDKLHAQLGKAMLSINAVKGFEIGSGFAGAQMKGSDHNDLFDIDADKIITKTNLSGGVQGGISNGMDIYFNIAFKPVATIMRDQPTVDKSGQKTMMKARGRHDPCVVPRAVPIVESMAALVIADFILQKNAFDFSH